MDTKAYSTVGDYLGALRVDPTLAVISMQMAADHRGVSRAAIDRMARIGQLEEVRIAKTRCVRAASLLNLEAQRERQNCEVRELLEGVARKHEIVFYEPVMKKLGLKTTVPAHRTLIGQILGDLSNQTYGDHSILLSVLVHRKTAGRTRPGPGFFELAKALGFKWRSGAEMKLVDEQTEKVWRHYASL
jgi:hypothetical protein